MGSILLSLACLASAPASGPEPGQESYLYQPAYSLDDELRFPAEPYAPQPGDIFLATDQEWWAVAGHWLAGGAGVHHSGIMFRRSDGRMALLEAGPFNSVIVETMDPYEHMRAHVACGDKVWVRRRRVPLTPEQSARLTAFIEAQDGKPFAVMRLLGQVTVFRSRGPLRTYFIAHPHGSRDSYFCSELVMESCCAAGLVDPETTRPSATYPRDLFFGRSYNLYLDTHLNLEPCWFPPARWTEQPAVLTPAAPGG
jgi:hypothetical protein